MASSSCQYVQALPLARTFAALLRLIFLAGPRPPLADAHGKLMVFGFWAPQYAWNGVSPSFRAGSRASPHGVFLAPLSEALGMLSMILIMMRVVPSLLAGPGDLLGFGMCLLSAAMPLSTRQHSVCPHRRMLGSAAMPAGLWARRASMLPHLPLAVDGFLVLTIVEERLELARFFCRHGQALPASSAAAVLSLPLRW